MSLRNRTLMLIALAFFVMIAVLFFVSDRLLTDSYTRLEQDQVGISLRQVKNALNNDIQSLVATTADWARWDETYNFTLGENAAYEANNVPTSATITNLGLHMMLFVNAKGEIVLAKVADPTTGADAALPDDITTLIEHPLVNRPPDDVEIRGGLTTVNQLPAIVTFAPVTRSDGKAPAVGTLIFVQYIDEARIQALAEALQLPLAMYPVSSADLPEDVQNAAGQIAPENPQVISNLSSATVAGYTLLTDLEDKPMLVARIELPRDITAQGNATFRVFMLALVVTGIAIMVLIAYVLERTVLSRLAYLSKSIDKIEAGSTTSVRVFVSGRDELANLGDGINQMLSRMDAYQQSIQANEGRLRAIVNAAPLLIWVIDRDEKLTFLEGSAVKALKLFPNRLIDQSVDTVRDQIGLEIALLRRAFNGEDASSEVHLADHIFSTAYRALRSENNEIIGVVGVATDITKTERAETALENKSRELDRARELLRSTVGQISQAMQRSADTQEIQVYVDFAQKELDKTQS